MSVHLLVEYSDRPGRIYRSREDYPDAAAALAHLRELAAAAPFDRPVPVDDTLGAQVVDGAIGVWAVRTIDGDGEARVMLVAPGAPDAAAAAPAVLVAVTAAVVVLLAVWTLAAPGPTVDGRGVLATALAAAVALAARASRRGRAER